MGEKTAEQDRNDAGNGRICPNQRRAQRERHWEEKTVEHRNDADSTDKTDDLWSIEDDEYGLKKTGILFPLRMRLTKRVKIRKKKLLRPMDQKRLVKTHRPLRIDQSI